MDQNDKLQLKIRFMCNHKNNCIIKHLMTGQKGNSEAEGNIEVEGKQNSLFPKGPVIKCFVIPPDSKMEKLWNKMICLTLLHT